MGRNTKNAPAAARNANAFYDELDVLYGEMNNVCAGRFMGSDGMHFHTAGDSCASLWGHAYSPDQRRLWRYRFKHVPDRIVIGGNEHVQLARSLGIIDPCSSVLSFPEDMADDPRFSGRIAEIADGIDVAFDVRDPECEFGTRTGVSSC